MSLVLKALYTEKVRKKSSFRLMVSLGVFLKLTIGRINVYGRNHLDQIPQGKKVIIATTHTSDLDLAIVAKILGHDFDIVLTHMSIHTSLKKSLQAFDPTIFGIYLAGRHNFLPVGYIQKKNENGQIERAGQIRLEDFQAMQVALQKGKTVVLAAHNPTFDGKLPIHAGFAAIRLAQLVENSVVLPVAVKIGDGKKPLGILSNMIETMFKRPRVSVFIGAPLEFNNPEAKKIGGLIQTRLISKKNLKIDRQKLNVFYKESNRLMQSLASL